MREHGGHGRCSLAKSLSPLRLTTIPSHGHTAWQGTRENVVQPWVPKRKSKWQAASSLCHNFHLRVRDRVLDMTYTALQTLSLCCPVRSSPSHSSHHPGLLFPLFLKCSSCAPAPRLCLCEYALPRCPHSSPIAPHSL